MTANSLVVGPGHGLRRQELANWFCECLGSIFFIFLASLARNVCEVARCRRLDAGGGRESKAKRKKRLLLGGALS